MVSLEHQSEPYKNNGRGFEVEEGVEAERDSEEEYGSEFEHQGHKASHQHFQVVRVCLLCFPCCLGDVHYSDCPCNKDNYCSHGVQH